ILVRPLHVRVHRARLARELVSPARVRRLGGGHARRHLDRARMARADRAVPVDDPGRGGGGLPEGGRSGRGTGAGPATGGGAETGLQAWAGRSAARAREGRRPARRMEWWGPPWPEAEAAATRGRSSPLIVEGPPRPCQGSDLARPPPCAEMG